MCAIYGKKVKSISRLIRHLNACKGHLYPKPQPPYELPKYKSHNKKDTLDGNWEDGGDLSSKTVIVATANGTFKISTKDTPWKGLFASEFSSALRKKWFSGYKFPAGTPILNK